MTTKNATAFLDWSLEVDCPHCDETVDLVELESDSGDYDIANRIFTSKWGELAGWDVKCPHCKHDFKLEKVHY